MKVTKYAAVALTVATLAGASSLALTPASAQVRVTSQLRALVPAGTYHYSSQPVSTVSAGTTTDSGCSAYLARHSAAAQGVSNWPDAGARAYEYAFSSTSAAYQGAQHAAQFDACLARRSASSRVLLTSSTFQYRGVVMHQFIVSYTKQLNGPTRTEYHVFAQTNASVAAVSVYRNSEPSRANVRTLAESLTYEVAHQGIREVAARA